jgi:hypothetical protein
VGLPQTVDKRTCTLRVWRSKKLDFSGDEGVASIPVERRDNPDG